MIGSYFAAEWMRKRDLRRAIAAHEAALAEVDSEDDAVPPAPRSLVRQ